MMLKIDPEFRDLIPKLSKEERKGLEENIKADGCHTPIFAWDDIIIDGHNRYEICQKHGIEFEVQPWEFDTRHDAIIWIIRNQFDRRNLSATARMDLALLLKSEIQAQAQERKKATEGRPKKGSKPTEKLPEDNRSERETRTQVAALAGVSGRTLDKYESVRDNAAPELLEATRRGDVSVHAASEATKVLTPEEQIEIASKMPGKIGEFTRNKIAELEVKNRKNAESQKLYKEANKKSLPDNYDKARHDDRLHHLHNLYDAIKSLSSMLPVEEIIASIPDYQHKRFLDLDKAVYWFNDFRKHYKEDRLE